MAGKVFDTDLIDEDDWNQAQWFSTLIALDPQREYPPVIGPVFRNPTAGRKIFASWMSFLGDSDSFNVIGVDIFENHYWHDEPGYFMVVTGNTDKMVDLLVSRGDTFDPRFVVIRSRIQRCADSGLLQQFKSDFNKHGRYFFVPAFQSGSGFGFDQSMMIEKTHISIQDYQDDVFRARFGDPGLLP